MSWKDSLPEKNRYFETENGILYCADSLKIMEQMPKESIDLVLTDPPYNIADSNKLTKVGNNIKTNNDAWGGKFKDNWDSMDSYSDWILSVMSGLYGILSDSGSILSFFDRKYTGYFVYLLEQRINLKFRNKIYFEKINPIPHIRKNNYRSCIEEAVWLTKSHDSNYYINFISQQDMKQIFRGNIGKKVTNHPTEKYEWMIAPLIKRHSCIGNLILDSFAGSGTTLDVAEKFNRKWIGIELNEEYCEIAKNRIMAVNKTKRLF